MTHLHLAVEEGHMNTVKHLVDKGADINTKDDHGVSVNASNKIPCEAGTSKSFSGRSLDSAFCFQILKLQ